MKTKQTPHVLCRLNRAIRNSPTLASKVNGDATLARIQTEAAEIIADLFAALRPSDGRGLAAEFLRRPAMPCTTARWLGYLNAETYTTVPGGGSGPYAKPIHRTAWAQNANKFRARVYDIAEADATFQGLAQ